MPKPKLDPASEARERYTGRIEYEGKTLDVTLGVNTWCDIEEALGKTYGQIINDLVKGASLRDVRAIIAHGLSNDKETWTAEEAGAVVAAIGLPAALDVIGTIVQDTISAPAPTVN